MTFYIKLSACAFHMCNLCVVLCRFSHLFNFKRFLLILNLPSFEHRRLNHTYLSITCFERAKRMNNRNINIIYEHVLLPTSLCHLVVIQNCNVSWFMSMCLRSWDRHTMNNNVFRSNVGEPKINFLGQHENWFVPKKFVENQAQMWS